MKLPMHGVQTSDIAKQIGELIPLISNEMAGKRFSLVYSHSEAHEKALTAAFLQTYSTNAVSPSRFPGILQLENEIVAMTSELLNGTPSTVGTFTSGGTESHLLALKAYRDWARVHRPKVKQPEIILSNAAHPSLLKAAAYLDLIPIILPINSDFALDASQVEEAINDSSLLIVASAPTYTHGIMDPISDLGQIALTHELPLHIDACLGGYYLPFMTPLGYRIPAFDFSVPGVTSVVTDLHKYGYAIKGASVLLFSDSVFRNHQFFISDRWCGGAYASPTLLGSRSGGLVAAAWASLMKLGRDGLTQMVNDTMEVRNHLIAYLSKSQIWQVVGDPIMTVLAITASDKKINALAQWLSHKGWIIDTQKNPDAIHLILTPQHIISMDDFIHDIDSYSESIPLPTSSQSQPQLLYGLNAEAALDSKDAIIHWLDHLYRL